MFPFDITKAKCPDARSKLVAVFEVRGFRSRPSNRRIAQTRVARAVAEAILPGADNFAGVAGGNRLP